MNEYTTNQPIGSTQSNEPIFSTGANPPAHQGGKWQSTPEQDFSEYKPHGMTHTELFEKLAEIEHERWADWQKYMHSKCEKVRMVHDGSGKCEDVGLAEVKIPLALFEQWERQIATPYSELSEKEKESDRDQVRRYWDLLN